MADEKGEADMIIKGAAIATVIGMIITISLLLFGGATKEQVIQLTGSFHEFAVSVDARLRVVENDQYRQREQILNEQSSYSDLKARLDSIEQASRANLAPNRITR